MSYIKLKKLPKSSKHKFQMSFHEKKARDQHSKSMKNQYSLVEKVKFGANGYKDFLLYNKVHLPKSMVDVMSKESFEQYKKNVMHVADMKRQGYLARHTVISDFSKPRTAGALAFWILWNKPTLKDSLKSYAKKFNFKIISGLNIKYP